MAAKNGRRPRVVVVGSYAVGMVMRVTRIPARGETVLGRDFELMDGGKGSNQAIACARLGADTTFIAALGADPYGDAALRLFQREGVDTSYVRQVHGAATGIGFILVDTGSDNAISVDLGANRLLSPADIDRAEAAIARADVLLTQLEIPAETALHAAAVARKHGVLTILNPAPAQTLPPTALADVDILTPNQTEAAILTGGLSTDALDSVNALRALKVRTVILTLGEYGAWIADEGHTTEVPAYQVTAQDTTGAGDAFSAALAVALAEGAGMAAAVRLACAAGALSVQVLGTVSSYATRVELETFMANAAGNAAASGGLM